VIFQSQNGTTQFSPISDGRFYQVSISRETIEAVEQVLTGADNSMGALYFVARKSADKTRLNWFDQNLTRLFAYGGHEFFS
jgi:N-acetylmuramoyl-L-alanine amidase